MPAPTAYDPSPNDKLTASAFDTGVRDPLNYYLNNHPRCHAYNSVAMSFASATARVWNFDAEVYDNDTMHSTSSNTSRITATTAGLYKFQWFMRMNSATYTQFDLDIRLNANANSAGGSSIFSAAIPFVSGTTFRLIAYRYKQFMNAGDYHEAFLTQASGGGAQPNIVGQFVTFVQARWIASS